MLKADQLYTVKEGIGIVPQSRLEVAALRDDSLPSSQCIKKRLAARFLAAPMGSTVTKPASISSELFRIVGAEHPAAGRFAVHIQNAEIHGMRGVVRFPHRAAPDLEDACIFDSRLMIEIGTR